MKCKCGRKLIKFPLWEGQEEGTKITESNMLWLNWIKMDLVSIIIFITVILMVWGYQVDTEKCDDAIEHPCAFCEATNCCEIDWGEIMPTDYTILDDSNIDIDMT